MVEKQIDRFTLEQEILECWGVIDDIRVVATTDNLLQKPEELQNALDAVCTLYQIKFQSLFETFEKLIANGTIE